MKRSSESSRCSGQGEPQHHQGPEEEVRARLGCQVLLPPARVAIPQHDLRVLAAGKAPSTGIRILSGVCRHEKAVSEHFKTSKLKLDMYAYLDKWAAPIFKNF